MMDAYKGGMYIENRVDNRARSILHNEPLPANTNKQQRRETAELLNTKMKMKMKIKDQRSKIKNTYYQYTYLRTTLLTRWR